MDLEAKSKGGLFPHTHTLIVPRVVIENSPDAGVVLTTSEEYSLIFKHKHQVSISKENLEKVRSGQEVVVFDNDKKRHSFALKV